MSGITKEEVEQLTFQCVLIERNRAQREVQAMHDYVEKMETLLLDARNKLCNSDLPGSGDIVCKIDQVLRTPKAKTIKLYGNE